MPDRQAGTILAFDFGLRRIGVAVGDAAIGVAHPLLTIDGPANDKRFSAIAALIGEWRPALLLVGLPRSLDGEAGEMTEHCRRFARRLAGRFAVAVRLVDERLSSVAAESALRAAGIATRRHKSRIDAAAAQVILQSYFDGGNAVVVVDDEPAAA